MSYEAALAGVSYRLVCTRRGVWLRFTGYSEKLPAFAATIRATMAPPASYGHGPYPDYPPCIAGA